MTTLNGSEPNRLQRRKARTRAALVGAAQSLLAESKINVQILEITQAADVGMGSFCTACIPPSARSCSMTASAWRTRAGVAPRARRDIEAAAEAGRFDIRDPELSMTIVAGAALRLGRLPHDHPERDDAEAADQVAEDRLRMFGLSSEEAHEICRRPLPPLDLPRVGSNP
ncbi:TetR/AcrR family transcriptional regulator [Nocardia sp. NPDC019304]|uniref:TetR/AcrR family transcriptional regulator n=1 Tax=unclassified Nocardia TaxID=2637762 RepID=UPI0033EAD508